MASNENRQTDSEKGVVTEDPQVPDELRNADGSSIKGEDILQLQDLDPALNQKMHLVNNVCLTAALIYIHRERTVSH